MSLALSQLLITARFFVVAFISVFGDAKQKNTEGKSMAAMIDLIKEGYFKEGSKVLYVHLGGQPAINGYTTAF